MSNLRRLPQLVKPKVGKKCSESAKKLAESPTRAIRHSATQVAKEFQKKKMGIASMVIGIIAAVLGFIPLCNYFAAIPAGVGFILGIVDVVLKSKKGEPKGMGIAGIVLNALAIALILLWTLVIAAGNAANQPG